LARKVFVKLMKAFSRSAVGFTINKALGPVDGGFRIE